MQRVALAGSPFCLIGPRSEPEGIRGSMQAETPERIPSRVAGPGVCRRWRFRQPARIDTGTPGTGEFPSEHTVQQPVITVSTLDLDRLEALLENTDSKAFPAAGQLARELDRAEVAEPADMPAGVVTMNSRVRFAADNGEIREYTLVYPKDMNGSPDRLSVLAPVGAALLGLSVGQTIEWPMPDGATLRLTVHEVIWQPEAAGELHR